MEAIVSFEYGEQSQRLERIALLLAERERLAERVKALEADRDAAAELVAAAVEYAEASIEYTEKGWHAIGMDRVDAARTAVQAAYRGWQVMHIRDARGQIAAGWPDLTLVKPPRIILAELKRERRYPTPIQRSWLALLDACPGVEVFRWYPRHWSSGEIERVLREG
jgi:hypothetical protein